MSGLRDALLPPLRRMERELAGSGRFRLLVATVGHLGDRALLIEAIEREHDGAGVTIELDVEQGPRWLEAEIARHGAGCRRIHVVGFENLADATQEWLLRLNYARESLSAATPTTVVLWMFEEGADALAVAAPDLWAWRAGVFVFPSRPIDVPLTWLPATKDFYTGRTLEQLQSFELQIRDELDMGGPVVAALYIEAAKLYFRLGRYPKALEYIRYVELHPLAREGAIPPYLALLRARILSRQGKSADAEAQLREWADVWGARRMSLLDHVAALAALLIEQGRIDDARLELERARPGPAARRYLLEAEFEGHCADFYIGRGEIVEALQHHERAGGLVASMTDMNLAMMASLARQAGHLAALQSELGSAISYYGSAAHSFGVLGDHDRRRTCIALTALMHTLRGHLRFASVCWAELGPDETREFLAQMVSAISERDGPQAARSAHDLVASGLVD